MTFGMVDSSKILLSIETSLPKYQLGENRLVIFKNTTAGATKPGHVNNEESTSDLFYIGHTGNFYDHLLFTFVDYANSEDAYYQSVDEPVGVVPRPPPPPKRRAVPEPEPEPPGLTEEERREREQKRREQMDEQMRNAAFEEEDEEEDAAVEAALAADEEEEEVVDLDD